MGTKHPVADGTATAPERTVGTPRQPTAVSSRQPTVAKIIIGGGFGVGKTTFVGAVSEITPLMTEAPLTELGVGDDLSLTPAKATTTVAMDFGRITLDRDLTLYLCGTPGQRRFWFMWDHLVRGAIGAVVLVDTRRLADSFPPLDYFEAAGIPFVVVINWFATGVMHDLEDVRDALALRPDVPLMRCDARNRLSVKSVLVALAEYTITREIEESAAERRSGAR